MTGIPVDTVVAARRQHGVVLAKIPGSQAGPSSERDEGGVCRYAVSEGSSGAMVAPLSTFATLAR